jgi:hypothetical protein
MHEHVITLDDDDVVGRQQVKPDILMYGPFSRRTCDLCLWGCYRSLTWT